MRTITIEHKGNPTTLVIDKIVAWHTEYERYLYIATDPEVYVLEFLDKEELDVAVNDLIKVFE